MKKNDYRAGSTFFLLCGYPFSICVLSNPSSGQDSEACVKSSMDTDCNPEKTAATISGSSVCSVVTGKGRSTQRLIFPPFFVLMAKSRGKHQFAQ